jgi:hypothetical protein
VVVAIAIELQAGFRVAFAAGEQVDVADVANLIRIDGKIILQKRHLAVGRVVVPFEHGAGVVDHRVDVEVGVLQIKLHLSGAVGAFIVKPHGQRVNVVGMPEELLKRVRGGSGSFTAIRSGHL